MKIEYILNKEENDGKRESNKYSLVPWSYEQGA